MVNSRDMEGGKPEPQNGGILILRSPLFWFPPHKRTWVLPGNIGRSHWFECPVDFCIRQFHDLVILEIAHGDKEIKVDIEAEELVSEASPPNKCWATSCLSVCSYSSKISRL